MRAGLHCRLEILATFALAAVYHQITITTRKTLNMKDVCLLFKKQASFEQRRKRLKTGDVFQKSVVSVFFFRTNRYILTYMTGDPT